MYIMITNILGQTPEEVAQVLKEKKLNAIRKCGLFAFVVLVVLVVITDSALVASLSFMGAIASMYVAVSDF